MFKTLQRQVKPRMLLLLMVSLILLTVTAAYLYMFKKPLKDFRQAQRSLTMLQEGTQPGGVPLASRLTALRRSNAELNRQIPSVSLPRDRFWDIQVSKIDSPTRQPLLPRPSCVRAASPTPS